MKQSHKLLFAGLLLVISALSFLLYSCIFPSSTNSSVTLQEVALSHQREDVQLIDLRTRSELEKTGIIPGAIHIDYYAGDFEEKLRQLDKDHEYIIYCHSGVRSEKTIDLMSELGINNVRDYSPGIKGWIAGGGETQEYK